MPNGSLSLQIERIHADDARYAALIQNYEAEFSAITQKWPSANGHFALDTELGGNVLGYLLHVDDRLAGAAAIKLHDEPLWEMCEFYVVPVCRQQGIGQRFARMLWSSNTGRWVIKQIAGAEYASAFWRRAIGGEGGVSYEEDCYLDPCWGMVTRQQFEWAG